MLNLMARKSADAYCATMTVVGFKNFGLMVTPIFVTIDHQVKLSSVSACFVHSKMKLSVF